MRRVILILLVLMQLMFFINYIINDGIIFFNIYVWSVLSLISLFTGWRAIRSEPNLYENRRFHFGLSLTLFILSIVSLIFIVLIAFTKPYFLHIY
ncbi:hypothetical protein [Salinicoccus halodurans]|uniref:Uncharacterized protein n=1 Tax=Salinicoccus halodurans TaxID=407035 RepID=A0A0F7HHI9_9STAP|nr:hypothetical protein [Salinicoccus halodurans]AKG72971.1 hypothetical protein AAT16_01260 [Salinicoccus halodurans]SFK76837.1 hypothetical protein SAMN05216235_1624 [Salinicoccus halodurans]